MRLTDIDSPNINDIFAGGYNSCYVNVDDEFYCWGESSTWQLGREGEDTNIPALIYLGAEQVVGYSAWTSFVCSLTDSGSVYCWGDNGYGRTGNGQSTGTSGPTSLNFDSGLSAVQVSVGGGHGCALMNNNYVSCWGMGNNG